MGGDALILEDGQEGLLHPVSQMRDLEQFGQQAHQDAGTYQKDQHRDTPHVGICQR